MRIAILHYHLRSGGVTRVIELAVRSALDRGMRVVVLTGQPSQAGGIPLERIRVIPDLGYSADGARGSPRVLAEEMLRVAREALGGDPDVLHAHNHALGKNPTVTGAVYEWVRQGRPALLQIHDFAEDGRPEMFSRLRAALASDGSEDWRRMLYPRAPHVHYAVINHRDARALSAGGISPEVLHFLPNAVALEAAEADAGPDEPPRIIYPVRPIRRKNLGEFLYWSACSEPGMRWSVTLAPTSAVDVAPYQKWIEFAREHQLPVDFEIGLGAQATYVQLLRSARMMMSTSVAEGFGMSFLEPWLAGRPVTGRLIPGITDDFEAQGVEFPGAYRRLDVPLEWVGAERYRQRLAAAMESSAAAYGRRLPAASVEQAMDVGVRSGGVDFGRLDEEMQRDAISALLRGRGGEGDVRPRVPEGAGPKTIARNRERILREYGLPAYGLRLERIYRSASGSAAGSAVEGADEARVLDFFSGPEQFSLLRT